MINDKNPHQIKHSSQLLGCEYFLNPRAFVLPIPPNACELMVTGWLPFFHATHLENGNRQFSSLYLFWTFASICVPRTTISTSPTIVFPMHNCITPVFFFCILMLWLSCMVGWFLAPFKCEPINAEFTFLSPPLSGLHTLGLNTPRPGTRGSPWTPEPNKIIQTSQPYKFIDRRRYFLWSRRTTGPWRM